jgi:hypothetical protein
MNTWSAERLSAFLANVRDDRLHTLWHSLAMTGVRRGKAPGLLWEDVDPDSSRVPRAARVTARPVILVKLMRAAIVADVTATRSSSVGLALHPLPVLLKAIGACTRECLAIPVQRRTTSQRSTRTATLYPGNATPDPPPPSGCASRNVAALGRAGDTRPASPSAADGVGQDSPA